MVAPIASAFVAPGECFERAKSDANAYILLPAAALVCASIALTVFYYLSVDLDWLRSQLVERMSSDRRDIAAKLITREFLLVTGVATAAIRLAIWLVLVASYFHWIDRVRGGGRSFGRWFYFTSLSYLPLLLLLPVGIVAIVLAPEHRILPNALDTTSFSHLLSSADGSWKGLADNISVIQLWPVALQMIGLSNWQLPQASKYHAWVLAALPTLILYGLWAITILVRSG